METIAPCQSGVAHVMFYAAVELQVQLARYHKTFISVVRNYPDT